MRQPAGGDHLGGGEIEIQRHVLCQRRHLTGVLPHADGPYRYSVDRNVARSGSQRTVQAAQGCRLTAAVGADNADEPAGRDIQIDIRNDPRAGDADGHVPKGDIHQPTAPADIARRRINPTKTGTPTAAVIAPSGSSCGGIAVRATRSAATRKHAPSTGATVKTRR
ncbi:Uncharacterised protein [Mycobacteroides abscessus subsp. massiliense]|nr:Uncharacterised protein [Mycobacteroides abscessus subsp. massiliense]